ncbi:hypothetical protein ACFOJE_16705 [Azotobacter bryophylli]|uniref:Uncharacterized protein n=1 Tax=Azotobacter bryophylli TaxID=1986537 RepID=A0ABV7AW95_9GAMM
MSPIVNSFIRPYFDFLYGAAYSLHQVLEGLDVTSSGFIERNSVGQIVAGYWSPEKAVLLTFAGLVIVIPLLIVLVSMAAYTLGRGKGVLIFLVLLCVPGALSCLGLFPDIHYLPERFVIHGTGVLGSEVGVIPLLIAGVMTGWAIVVLLYDSFSLTDKFRQYYDHLWFPMALVAAVFFVKDNGAVQDSSMLSEGVREVRQSSQYLLGQVRRYQDYCSSNGMSGSKSCKWSYDVQPVLSDIAGYDGGYFIEFAPDSSLGFYAGVGAGVSESDVLEIRKEIAVYNQAVCPVRHFSNGVSRMSPVSSSCEVAPFGYCTAFPDGPDGLVDKHIGSQPVALASECIIPSLVARKPSIAILSNLVVNDKRDKNQRWLYFILVSVMVGGKVANSSTKVAEIDVRPAANRRVVVGGLYRLMCCFARACSSVIQMCMVRTRR